MLAIQDSLSDMEAPREDLYAKTDLEMEEKVRRLRSVRTTTEKI